MATPEQGGPAGGQRTQDVERILRGMFEHGWEGFGFLEGWDGQDLEALRPYLGEEEFETLLAELAAAEEDRSGR